MQILFISTFFGVLDLYSYGPLGGLELGGPLPWQAVVGVFLVLSVRSRLFSPLDNSRPDLGEIASPEEDKALREELDSGKSLRVKELRAQCEKRGLMIDNTMDRNDLAKRLQQYMVAQDAAAAAPASGDGASAERIMPSWTPPGVTFPIMWLLVVAPLRAFAASMVYETASTRLNAGHLDDPVLLWLVLHLCIGDTWNTVNNVEQRTGAAVPGVVLVWASALFAAKQFYDVNPTAGLLLGATGVWLTVAGALVADTWRVNNAVRAEPLYPYKRPGYKSQTRFTFED